jgi:2,3-dihydroxybiphenyl 1,2-dioxygenase
MLGLPEPVANRDGSVGYQVDDAAQRLVVRPGTADDLAALGFECRSVEVLERLTDRVGRAGVRAEPGSVDLAAARQVERLVSVIDPMGNPVELYVGPNVAAKPFTSALMPGGFKTGDLGLGHAVLVSRNLDLMERFYVDLLGFAVTERLSTRVGPIPVRGTFLHCNRRHHSLAFFDLPLRKRLHHFMLQASQLVDVGMAFERAKKNRVPLSLDIGQHPAPDATFSFYGQTPSGFDFEIGAGGNDIDPDNWRAPETNVASSWGHHPSLRLRVKIVKEVIARNVGL